MKSGNIIKEFERYLIVGGSAFIVDFVVLYIFQTYVFYNLDIVGIYLSTALGFIGGLIYNYVLSLIYVFESAKELNKGKNVKSFIVFTIVGIIGLMITELGMYIGVGILAINYLFVKVCVSGIVLLWNYGTRKILIF